MSEEIFFCFVWQEEFGAEFKGGGNLIPVLGRVLLHSWIQATYKAVFLNAYTNTHLTGRVPK